MMLHTQSCCLSLWFSVTASEDKGVVFTKVLAFISTFTTVTTTIAALAGSTSLTVLNSLLVEDGVARIGLNLRVAMAAFHLVTRAYRMFTFWLQRNSVVQFSFGMFSILERMAPADVCNASRDRSKTDSTRESNSQKTTVLLYCKPIMLPFTGTTSLSSRQHPSSRWCSTRTRQLQETAFEHYWWHWL